MIIQFSRLVKRVMCVIAGLQLPYPVVVIDGPPCPTRSLPLLKLFSAWKDQWNGFNIFGNPCDWGVSSGVTCDANGVVTRLFLYGKGIRGTVRQQQSLTYTFLLLAVGSLVCYTLYFSFMPTAAKSAVNPSIFTNWKILD